VSFRLEDKVVLVTGAASGIGAATARAAAAAGAKIVATDRDGSGAERVGRKCGGLGLAHEVTDPGAWDDVIARTVAEFGRLDGLSSNAGNAGFQPIAELDLAAFRQLAAVHVEANFIGLQKTVAQMRRQAEGGPAQGSIVVCASVMASEVAPGVASYATVKAALANMAKAIGVELGRKGDFIRVNAVSPGPVDTPLLRAALGDEAMRDPASWNDVPLGRPATPEEVADTIIYLLSDEASFATATQLVVDGGWSLT
jgi:3alpha(or 20beta)-hydroxysteroid dehydrogenase